MKKNYLSKPNFFLNLLFFIKFKKMILFQKYFFLFVYYVDAVSLVFNDICSPETILTRLDALQSVTKQQESVENLKIHFGRRDKTQKFFFFVLFAIVCF